MFLSSWMLGKEGIRNLFNNLDYALLVGLFILFKLSADGNKLRTYGGAITITLNSP